MLLAIKVTSETLLLVTDLNQGQAPTQEHVDNPTYFIWAESRSVGCQFVSEEVYKENFQRTNLTMFFPVVREI